MNKTTWNRCLDLKPDEENDLHNRRPSKVIEVIVARVEAVR